MDPSQPTVEAVAVRDGKVLAAGSLDECASWGPHTVDDRFADHVLTPGMIEAHAHTFEGAFGLLPYAGWFPRHRPDGSTAPGVKTYDDLLDLLRRLDQETQGSSGTHRGLGFRSDLLRRRGTLDSRPPGPGVDGAAHLRLPRQCASRHGQLRDAHPSRGHPRDPDRWGSPAMGSGEPNGELQEMPAIALATSAIHMIMRMMGDPEAIRTLGQMCANTGITSLVDLGASGVTRPEGPGRVAPGRHRRVSCPHPPATPHRHDAGVERLGSGRGPSQGLRSSTTPLDSGPPD